MQNHDNSRRRFLGNMLSLAGGSALPFTLNLAAMGTAAAENATDYKALVCLFLTGGNDHYNTVLDTQKAAWDAYRNIRTTEGGTSIALPFINEPGGVLTIAPATPQSDHSFALHPQLGPMATLFAKNRMAILTNVGTLTQPLTMTQYQAGSAAVPPRLFSHNDQQAMWQTSQAEAAAGSGWGGRLGDILAASNATSTFTCISNGGNALFLSGRQVRQYQVGGAAIVPIRHLDDQLFGAPTGSNPLRQVISGYQSDVFRRDHAAVTTRAINAESLLGTAMAPAGAGGVPDPTPYINPNTGLAGVNPLAVQLQTIARIIAGRSTLGAKRQVFYVSLNGFDTHDDQRVNHANLMAKVAHAVAYFDLILGALQGTNMRNQVTLFTASDFGRTLTSNGDGTDHGWGAHHFIVGGAVKGRDVYGSMPQAGLGHNLDVGSGALLPTTSVDQYGATLAGWFGLSAPQIGDIFPNISRFSNRNLGFMGA